MQKDIESIYLNGFLPNEEPKIRLISDNISFSMYENIMSELPKLNETKKIREKINELPDFDYLSLNKSEYCRARLILGMLIHSYVWNDLKNIIDIIPKKLSVPFYYVSEKMGLKLVLTYTDLILNNWNTCDSEQKLLFEKSNIVCLNTLTHFPDEKWFYMIHVSIEKAGSIVIKNIIDIHNENQISCDKDKSYIPSAILDRLKIISSQLIVMSKTLDTMNIHCNPSIFFKEMRKYLSGWDKKELLPNGLIFDGVLNNEPQFCTGGSGAQSALFPVFDAAFGVVHEDEFFLKIQEYMLPDHRLFINFVKENVNILKSINCWHDWNDFPKLLEAYNECKIALKRFRQTHVGIAYKYVIMQVKAEQNELGIKSFEEIKGTSNTNLLSFLKQSVKETNSDL